MHRLHHWHGGDLLGITLVAESTNELHCLYQKIRLSEGFNLHTCAALLHILEEPMPVKWVRLPVEVITTHSQEAPDRDLAEVANATCCHSPVGSASSSQDVCK